MFSVGDIYGRIKAFKDQLSSGNQQKLLYFAKVDVQAAFDTIPQEAMLKLLKRIPGQSRYKLSKHVEVQPLEVTSASNAPTTKASKRWHSTAKPLNDKTPFFPEALEKMAASTGKKNTLFIDSAALKAHDTCELLALATSHIEQNLVRIGKKYYRQKNGIPQGSVLSSTLCNYFYADLERKHLAFLQSNETDGDDGNDSLLMRLIDDFLLITTDRKKAARFVQTMHRGVPAYGVQVNPAKSLVNFRLDVDGIRVLQIGAEEGFPYCGLRIDCKTLHVAKQRDGVKDPGMFFFPFPLSLLAVVTPTCFFP